MYSGYLLKIKGVTLPFLDGANIVESGSYKFEKAKNTANEWVDSWGNRHVEDYHNPKIEISFTIKDRTEEQQRRLKGLFDVEGALRVEYFDDYTQEYGESNFVIDSMGALQAIATPDTVMYKSMDVKLREL